MRGKRGFSRLGALVVLAVALGTPAPSPVAFAAPTTPAPPIRAPHPTQASYTSYTGASAPAPSSAGLEQPAPTPTTGELEQPAKASEQPRDEDAPPPSPSALPLLGHFGAPVDRPLKGRITLANPTGETLGFRIADPTLLPAGITLDADGLLGGSSRVPGTWTVPVQACAPSGGCATGTITITITCRCAQPSPPPSAHPAQAAAPPRTP